MNFTLNTVYSIKLTSGEELVARVTKVDGHNITVQNPLSVAPGPQGMGLMHSMFTADPDSEITLNSNTITMAAPTDSSVKSKYVEATTGLVIPDKKIIMG